MMMSFDDDDDDDEEDEEDEEEKEVEEFCFWDNWRIYKLSILCFEEVVLKSWNITFTSFMKLSTTSVEEVYNFYEDIFLKSF